MILVAGKLKQHGANIQLHYNMAEKWKVNQACAEGTCAQARN
jgi:hypothetical protein